MFYLYILKSRRTGKYYIGSTGDLARRVREHNGELAPKFQGGRSTVAARPWELVFQAHYASRSCALAAESYVKGMKSKHWIEKLVEGTYRLPDV